MTLAKLRRSLNDLADKKKAALLQRYFKTGPGEYAEGDIFIGVTVPALRRLAKECRQVELLDALALLKSPIHEERLLALLLLIGMYRNADPAPKEKIYRAYLDHTKYINNWDLVDVSAKHIVGEYLFDKDRALLYDLARSKSLWERRIAILSTFYFIGRGQMKDSLALAEMLLDDNHDLMHKAVGWMLREVGKRDQPAEESFLKKCSGNMPRTMLRYAIERFPEKKRLSYLRGRA